MVSFTTSGMSAAKPPFSMEEVQTLIRAIKVQSQVLRL